ncbi:sphingosine-1-phosphate lyase isoform X2 [Procambarus clarkii]|uniref:sphingosine-1-phosphate lyase isoform X2 n=1 Tax=Procambarus clarkii TaxID=6728 RepID=UPI001E6749C7|nr:sphingosine-1-phosphate lyase 1-like isoform X2 [Procambarus clarkii]
MENVHLMLKWLEEEVESSVDGFQRWQLVVATAAFTLTVMALRDLFNHREDVWEGMRKRAFRMLRSIPAVQRRISEVLDASRRELEKGMFAYSGRTKNRVPLRVLPPTGWSKEQVLQAASDDLAQGKYDWRDGKISGGTFSGGNDVYTNLLEHLYGKFALSNPLHADVFPGVRKMEAEIVRMTVSLFHGNEEQCGCITSGGSESILMAVKAMRDWGRDVKGINKAEIVACVTAHAAFSKAADILGMKLRQVKMDPETCKVNLSAMRRAINGNTVMYGNAPKGSSVVMYRSGAFRHHQYFTKMDWPGGIYGTPTVPGSRPGGSVAVCWGALLYHGVAGYTETTRTIINTARGIKNLLKAVPGLEVFGDPLTSIVAFRSKEDDIYKIGDILGQHGWHLNFIQYPPGIHICVTSLQAASDFPRRFVSDVNDAVQEVRKRPDGLAGVGKVYGTAAGIPDKSLVGEAAKMLLTCYYETGPAGGRGIEEIGNEEDGQEI